MVEDQYQFLVYDNFATGEGQTISLLITRAYPRSEDYDRKESESGVNPDGSFHFEMPPLKQGNTARVRALREFVERFGGWHGESAQFLPRDQFLAQYAKVLPDHIVRFLKEKEHDDAGNFQYFSQYHINFS